MRRISALVLVAMMAVAGCGSAKTASTTAPSAAAGISQSAAAGTGTTGSPAASTGSSATDASCPTFLINRYIYQPYSQGKFKKGHSGRTVALIKAAATAATAEHLLKNASLNAKANPALCKTIAAPLSSLTSTIGGLAGSLRGGAVDPGVLGGLGGAVTGLLGKAKTAGVPVTEKAAAGS